MGANKKAPSSHQCEERADGGDGRIRTAVQGFAGLCLTTRPRHHQWVAKEPHEAMRMPRSCSATRIPRRLPRSSTPGRSRTCDLRISILAAALATSRRNGTQSLEAGPSLRHLRRGAYGLYGSPGHGNKRKQRVGCLPVCLPVMTSGFPRGYRTGAQRMNCASAVIAIPSGLPRYSTVHFPCSCFRGRLLLVEVRCSIQLSYGRVHVPERRIPRYSR